jgi:CubicO group peptidase (beta-lactamase class C family)
MQVSRRPFLLGALAATLPGAAFAQGATEFEGAWFGALEIGAQRLRLRLDVTGDSASITSLDQGGAVIPASSFTIVGPHIALAFAAVNGAYEGALRDGRIEGAWTQGASTPLTFGREPIAAAAAPAPIAPESLTQERLAALRAGCGAPAMIAAAASRAGARLSFVDGVRALGREEAATTADKWHIGSITKSMTATLVARCVEAGLVSWDDTLGAVLGGAAPDMRPEYRDANFLHLMSHRAGLQANLPLADLVAFPREETDARASRIAYARAALAQAPAGAKEEHFLYSNSGFVLAGAMLEQKLGATWESIIAEHLFAPLGMSGAGFGAPGTPGAYDQPVGHAAADGTNLAPFPPGGPLTDNPAVLGPAGRVHAGLDDMLAYLSAHGDRSDVLSAASWERLHTPPFGGEYALGWVLRGPALWHNGSNTLWYAEASFEPGAGRAAFAAVNDGRIPAVAGAVNAALQGASMAL